MENQHSHMSSHLYSLATPSPDLVPDDPSCMKEGFN